MKRTSLLAIALLALGLVFSTAGCSTFSKSASVPKSPGTFALIVSVSGGQAPTDAQWATMQKNFASLLAARGLVLVTDPTLAEKIIQVLFVPDADNPDMGISYIVGVRPNTGTVLATTSPTRLTGVAGYGFTNVPSFASLTGQPQYYGYYPDYTDVSYTSAPIASGTQPTMPPTHDGGHHVSRPVDCLPDTTPHHPPSGHAGNNPPSGGNHWWNSRPSSEPASTSYSSSSYSSHSSSDYVGPSTSYSSSASNSSPSISFPSNSSSSSSFSSQPAASSSSSSDSGRTISFPERPL